MNDNDAKFRPAQIDHQIDMLAHHQSPWPDTLSDIYLISELYQVYTEDEAIAENAWLRLKIEVEATRPLKAVANPARQGRSPEQMSAERQKRAQGMRIRTTEKRSERRVIRHLEIYAALLVIVALIVGTTFAIRNAHQAHILSTGTPISVTSGTQTPSTSAPIPIAGSIYVSSQSGIYREDLSSKRVLWHYSVSQKLQNYGDVYVVGNVAVFSIASFGMVGVDITTGKQLWVQQHMPDTLLAAGNGLVIGITDQFVSTQTSTGRVDRIDLGIGTITAYQAATGQPKWSHKLTLSTNVPIPYQKPTFNTVLANSVFYLIDGSQMFAYSVPSGELLWNTSLPPGFNGTFVITDPVVSGNTLYFFNSKMVDNDSQAWLFAISTTTGKEIWHVIAANYDYGGYSPTVINGIVYVAGAPASPSPMGVSDLYAYNASDGGFIRSYPAGPQGQIVSSPLHMQKLVICFLFDGPSKNKLVAFDTQTEKTAWFIEVGTLNTDPQIVNNVIYAPIGSQIIAYTTSGKMISEYDAHRTPSKTGTTSIPGANFTIVS